MQQPTSFKGSTTSELILGALAIVAAALLWISPPVGFLLTVALLAVLPPWGKSITERAIISVTVIAGLVALTIPRGSDVPVTQSSARIGLVVLLVAAFALRFVPKLKKYAAIPKPTAIDASIAVLVAVIVVWLVSAYRGAGPYGTVSGLFFTGWDNQGHFVPFANTYEVGKTAWPTLDGSVGWNQWYPSLHTTLFALITQASHAAKLDRIQLLGPYVQTMAVSFALCMGALAWIASDLTKHIAKAVRPEDTETNHKSKYGTLAKVAPFAAIAAFALFALVGTPAELFNAGFTNFVMAVTIVAVVAYLGSRSLRSAARIGWLLVPLGSLAVIGLWTPLVLGIAPAGVVVLIALSKKQRWLGIVWAIATVALVGGTTYLQTKAIVNVSGKDAGGFTQELGAENSGMIEFNTLAALIAPVNALVVAMYLIKRKRITTALAAAGSTIAVLPFLIIAIMGAVAAGKGWLESYYVLKTLYAILLFAAPLYAAIIAIGATAITLKFAKTPAARTVLATLIAILLAGGFILTSGNPGLQASKKRTESVENSLVGEAIVNSAEAAKPYPEKMPLMWDGAGTLPNLWLASLSGVMSKEQQTFYLSLPPFPYEAAAQQYVFDFLASHPNQHLALMWFRDISGQQLQKLQTQLPNQVTLVKVPMRSSLLCQECHL